MRMYHSNAAIPATQLARRVEVPSGFSLFPGDIVRPPRTWLERTANVVRVTEPARGGHFAPFEEPELYAEELRTFFRPTGHQSRTERVSRRDRIHVSTGKHYRLADAALVRRPAAETQVAAFLSWWLLSYIAAGDSGTLDPDVAITRVLADNDAPRIEAARTAVDRSCGQPWHSPADHGDIAPRRRSGC